MTRDDLLDRLYRARRELTRLIIATSPKPDEHEQLEKLLDERDKLVWEINRINLSELTAATAQVETACEAIASATEQLKSLTSTIENINKGLALASEIVGAASGLAAKLVM